jgi:isoleucyl-tRNA synthetase/predicted GNAT family acetyltransferase
MPSSFPELEKEILAAWQREETFKKSLEKTAGGEPFVFFEGPPFATGMPHYGHLITSVAKDIIPRFQTMRGRRVERRWGWDCHGLPIENIAEKNLGVSEKKEIEDENCCGVAKFNCECQRQIGEYAADWRRIIDRLGRWVSWEETYQTMDPSFTESVWWAFAELFKKGRIYESRKVVPFCTRCETPLSIAETRADDSTRPRKDLAVTVKFLLTAESRAALAEKLPGGALPAGEISLLAWTTTPWTLPSNQLLAVSQEGEMALVRRKDSEIREAETAEEKERVWEFFAAEYPKINLPRAREDFLENSRWIFFLEKKGEITAAIDFREQEEDFKISRLIVAKELRKKGIGARLLSFAEKKIAELGGKKILLNGEVDAVGFWEKLGFAKISELEEMAGISFFKMEKELAPAAQEELFLLAADAVERIFGEGGAEILETFPARELAGLKYQPLFPEVPAAGNTHQIITAPHVTADDGTGIVHLAEFGEEDFELFREREIAPLDLVDARGLFKPDAPFAGENIFEASAEKIPAELARRGALFAKEKIEHNYPHCWRCDTPLQHRPLHAWFLRVEDLRERMLELDEKEISWVPANVRTRWRNWLAGARDWCLSRNRYWGAPLPVWKCSGDGCEEVFVPGSYAELEEKAGEKVENQHRPAIDELSFPCEKCGAPMKRIPEVLDCWFESGAMPFAQHHFPFEKKEKVEKETPADFTVEYVNQTRAWFYYLHVLSTALFDRAPVKNFLCHGIVLGDDGRKASKRLKNFPDVEESFEKFGADAVRLGLAGSPCLAGGDVCVGEDLFAEAEKKILRPWKSALDFWRTFVKEN